MHDKAAVVYVSAYSFEYMDKRSGNFFQKSKLRCNTSGLVMTSNTCEWIMSGLWGRLKCISVLRSGLGEFLAEEGEEYSINVRKPNWETRSSLMSEASALMSIVASRVSWDEKINLTFARGLKLWMLSIVWHETCGCFGDNVVVEEVDRDLIGTLLECKFKGVVLDKDEEFSDTDIF